MQKDQQSIPKGIILTIIRAQNLHLQEVDANAKIRAKVIAKEAQQETSLKNIDDCNWKQVFCYNTEDFVDDDIKIQVRTDNGQLVGETLKTFSRELESSSKEGTIQLSKNGRRTGQLIISLSFREMEYIVGSVKMPQLSLRPDHIPQKSQVQSIQTQDGGLQNRIVSHANCFSVLDNDINQGFEWFPSKFKARQQRQY